MKQLTNSPTPKIAPIRIKMDTLACFMKSANAASYAYTVLSLHLNQLIMDLRESPFSPFPRMTRLTLAPSDSTKPASEV